MMKLGDYLKIHYIFTVEELKNVTPQMLQKLRSRLSKSAIVLLDYFVQAADEIDKSTPTRRHGTRTQGLLRDKSFIVADTDVCDIHWIVLSLEEEPDSPDESYLDSAQIEQNLDTDFTTTSGFEHIPDMDLSREGTRALVGDKTLATLNTLIEDIKWFMIPTSSMIAEFAPRPVQPIPLTHSPMELWQFIDQTCVTIQELHLAGLNIGFTHTSMAPETLVVELGYEHEVENSVFVRDSELITAHCPFLESYQFEYTVTGPSVDLIDTSDVRMCYCHCSVM